MARPRRFAPWLPALIGAAFALHDARAAEPKPAADPNAPVSFSGQVLPVLQRKCQGCHQPAKAKGKLVLTSFEALKAGGETGPGFEPGKPADSQLVENVSGPKPLMPPQGPPLTPEEVASLTRWVAQGGHDDTPPSAKDTIDADHPPTYNAAPLITALAFAPDGKTLAVSGYREVLIHKADGTGLLRRLVGQAQRIESLTFAPDGTVLAAVGGSPGRFGEVQFWDAGNYTLRGRSARRTTPSTAAPSPPTASASPSAAPTTRRGSWRSRTAARPSRLTTIPTGSSARPSRRTAST